MQFKRFSMSSCSNLCAREKAPAGRKGLLQSRTKVLIHQGSSPLPLTYNADNQVIFSLFMENNALTQNKFPWLFPIFFFPDLWQPWPCYIASRYGLPSDHRTAGSVIMLHNSEPTTYTESELSLFLCKTFHLFGKNTNMAATKHRSVSGFRIF